MNLPLTVNSLILLLILAGCGANYHLRRAEKHIRKAEQLGAKWHSDTIYYRVPVITPEIAHDTTFLYKPSDTVVIKKDRLTVKYVAVRDSVYIEGKCESDTVEVEVPVTVTKTIEAKPFPWIWLLVAFVGGVVFLAVIRR